MHFCYAELWDKPKPTMITNQMELITTQDGPIHQKSANNIASHTCLLAYNQIQYVIGQH
jgi:hypothetical protein